MKKLIYLIILLLTCRICGAQNLVPNGDFEQYTACPTDVSQFAKALYWFSPTTATPDYFNACAIMPNPDVPYNYFGYQFPHSGVAYGGLFPLTSVVWGWSEYMEIQLTSSLLSNICYHFEMYINLGNFSAYTTDDIGAYFADTMITGNSYYHLPLNPQIINTTGFITDTMNWVLISGNYTANGGENYLIIGNFIDAQNTDTIPFNPNITFMRYTYFHIDDVSLTPCTGLEENKNSDDQFSIYPNPVKDKLNITATNKELSEITLYDITSRKLLQKEFTNSITLNTEQFAKGIYLYEVRNKSGAIKKGKVVKTACR
jgi:type IX secretion system substrate protein